MYVSITLFIDVLHNHQEIGRVHDDCAACRWADQSQDTSIGISVAQAFFVIPTLGGVSSIIPDDIEVPTQFYKSSIFIRPPPAAI
jgi:hypothetical protein